MLFYEIVFVFVDYQLCAYLFSFFISTFRSLIVFRETVTFVTKVYY